MFEAYQKYDILNHVNKVAIYLDHQLEDLARKKKVIKQIRGLGLMKGIELFDTANHYIEKLQELGIIVIPSGNNVIRLLPPLVIKEEHVDMLIQALKRIL